MAEQEAPTTEPQEEGPSMAEMARGLFGDNFKGKVPEPNEPETQEPAEEVQAEEAEHEVVASEEEVETTDGEEQEEEASEAISSFDELVNHYEWDPDWAKTLKMPVKVDGETSEATLEDLVSNYQMNQAADKRLEEAKAKAQSQTQEYEQKVQSLEQQFVQAGKLIENAEALLDKDSQSIDWKQLREDDPAEYSAKKAEFAERRQEIDRMKQEAVEFYQSSVNSRQPSEEEQKKQLQAEHEALISKIPEWKEPDRAQEDKNKLARYLMDSGFSEQDVRAASDHRLIVLAHKARLYDEGQKKMDVAKKKVAKVPKMAKPGPAKNQQEQSESRKAKQARERLKKTGSFDDALNVMRSGG